MKICKRCNLTYEDSDIFCSKCGGALSHVESEEDRIDPAAANVEVSKVNNTVREESTPIESYAAPRREVDPDLIEKYRQEIKKFKTSRTILVSVGIVLTVLFFALTLVFAALFVATAQAEFIVVSYDALLNDYGQPANTYLILTYLCAIFADTSPLLIILGGVINSTRIRNRQRLIDGK